MSHKETQHTPNGAGAAENAAWAFYLIAALGSTIGQIWVGAEVPPWPHDWPIWIRIALVLPFAVVIDLGGVVCSAFADSRQKLGESAYGWRILSAASVCLGVGINMSRAGFDGDIEHPEDGCYGGTEEVPGRVA